jgi:hypothetical protein
VLAFSRDLALAVRDVGAEVARRFERTKRKAPPAVGGAEKGGALLCCGKANLADLSVPLNRQTTCWIG